MDATLRKPRRIAAAGILALVTTLLLAPAPVLGQDGGFRARRVWKGDPDPFCCGNTMVSIDGRYVPGWDSNTGNLQFLDMLENRWVRVTDKGTWATSDVFSLNPMFSPDGRWIAHSWADEEAGGLRLDRADGSEHRVLLPGVIVAPLDWSPDGSSVLAIVRRLDQERLLENNRGFATRGWDELILVPVTGGEPHVLKRVEVTGTVDGRMALTPSSAGMGMARFSPDGRWIAYQRYAQGTADSDIHVLSADGEVDGPLVTGEGNDRLLGWVQDGSGILLHSEREARPGIWRLAVRNGSPDGSPEFVRDDVWGMEPMGMGEQGFYYMVRAEERQVHTAEIDFNTGEIVSVATPVRDPGSGTASGSPAWSPDGRQLAYGMWLPGEPLRTEIAVRSLETGDVRSFVLDLGVEKIAWGSDPLTLFMHATRRGGETGIHRLDLQSGEITAVLVGDEAPGNLEDRFKRDGRTVAVPYGSGGPGITGYRVRDLETGREMEIETGGWSSILAFPGAERYAVWTERGPRDGSPVDATLSVVGVDGSRRTVWEDAVQGRFMRVTAITSDGEHVLVTIGNQVMIVDVATGDHRYLRIPPGDVFQTAGMGAMVIQPNGNRIAVPAGRTAVEIWLIEGIGNPTAPAR